MQKMGDFMNSAAMMEDNQMTHNKSCGSQDDPLQRLKSSREHPRLTHPLLGKGIAMAYELITPRLKNCASP